jgi:predicted MFS family arabinose efflux permease
MQPDSRIHRAFTLGAMFHTGLTSSALVVVKPLIVGALIDQYHFTPREAGFVAGIEMLGIGFAAFLVGIFGPRWRRRTVVRAGAALGILGSAVPFAAGVFPAVLALRLVAGLGCGLVAGVVLSTLGMTRDPDRTFGLYFLTIYLASALLFPLSSWVIHGMGADGGYLLLAAILATAFATAFVFPDTAVEPPRKASGERLAFPLGGALLSLSVSITFWIGLGAFVAFSERLGLDRGITGPEIAGVLGVAQFASIAGAFTASLLHTRIGRAIPTLCALGFALAGFVLLSRTDGFAGFAAAVLLIYYAWPLFLAYLNGTMSVQDRAGRIVALSVTSQTVGMAIGPSVAGVLVSSHGYGAVVGLGLAASFAAMTLLVPLVISTRQAGNDAAFQPIVAK